MRQNALGQLARAVRESLFAGARLPARNYITVGPDTPGLFTGNRSELAHNGKLSARSGWLSARAANGTRSAAVTVPAGSMLRFRYLADGGIWFDDETTPAPDGQDVSITV